MPADVPTLVFKGLAEGLTLHAAEREPADEDGLRERFEELLDHPLHGNQLASVIRDVQDADYVRAPDDDEALHLTQEGARRLAAYRRMPEAFKATLVELFRIPPEASTEPEASPGSRSLVEQAGSRIPTSGWVEQALAEIPDDVEMQAPYAQVSLDRDPAARAWTLRVQRHEPGRYEGAGECPLTFLFAAATRLVAQARGRRVRP